MVLGRHEQRHWPADRLPGRMAEEGGRAGTVEQDVAVLADADDGVRGRFDDRTQALLALPQGRLRRSARLPLGRLGQFARHRRRQPREGGFHQIVVRAAPHQGDGLRLLDDGRDDDEGDVLAAGVQEIERLAGAEARQAEIREDDIPAPLAERGREVGGVVDAPGMERVAGAPQLTQHQREIVFVVFDGEYRKRGAHGGLSRAPALW